MDLKENFCEIVVEDIELLDSAIKDAKAKLKTDRENDLCRYIPVSSGGYIHHFTFRKLKVKDPKKLARMIEQFILEAHDPQKVPPKQRHSRNSRKHPNYPELTTSQLQRLINMAKIAGDEEMLKLLMPKKTLSQSKIDLIRSIRDEETDPLLWHAYIDGVKLKKLEEGLPTNDTPPTINSI